MLDTSARLLRLLSLLQSRRFWPGQELSERLEVTPRTVRRDVDRLRSLGYPVASSAGVAGGYQLGSGAQLPPLLLDDEEALAMSVGLRSAVTSGIEGFEEASLRVMTKLEQVMPERLRGRLAGIHGAITQNPLGGPVVSASTLGALASAAWSDLSVSFEYVDGAGKSSRRRCEPHGVVHVGRRWYLAAFDVDRDDWRTFRVDRISGEVEVGPAFARRSNPAESWVELVTRSMSRSRPETARVVIFAPYETVRAKVPVLAAHLTAIDDDRTLLETGIASMRHLALHLGLLEEELEVESPPELVEMMGALAARLSRAAERGAATQR